MPEYDAKRSNILYRSLFQQTDALTEPEIFQYQPSKISGMSFLEYEKDLAEYSLKSPTASTARSGNIDKHNFAS